MRVVLLTLAYVAAIIGLFWLPMFASLWIEHALGGSPAATWLALLAYPVLWVLTGLCLASPLWAVLDRVKADRSLRPRRH